MNTPEAQPDRAGDFKFTALQAAVHYRKALIAEFRPHLRGRILEVGAGVGQVSELLLREPGIARLIAVEPDTRFSAQLRTRFPELEVVEGTINALPASRHFDTILNINVLEHIEADERELAAYHERLERQHGVLCLFVPARPEIYGSIDRDFGHCRRYGHGELRGKLEAAGFHIQRLTYFNLAGYFAWWWNFRIRKKHAFTAVSVRFFDRCIFPLQHAFESHVWRPPIGQSLIAVAIAG